MFMPTSVQNLFLAAAKSVKRSLPRGSVISAALFAIVASAALADTGKDRLEEFLSELHTFWADFEQVLLDERGSPIESASGTLVLARPGRFRWDYAEPYPQLIVADGKYVWIYDAELAQVTVKELGEAVGDTPTLLLTSDSSLDERFLIRETGRREGLEWVSLEPKSADVSFSEIRLGLGRDGLERMELVDSFGQTTKLHFQNILKNIKVRPELFFFTPPVGVDVIGDGPVSSKP